MIDERESSELLFFSLFVVENQVKYTISSLEVSWSRCDGVRMRWDFAAFHHCACIFFRFGSSLIITILSLSFLLFIECYQLNSTLNFFSSSPFLPTTTLLLSLSSLSKIYILFLFYHKENSLSVSLYAKTLINVSHEPVARACPVVSNPTQLTRPPWPVSSAHFSLLPNVSHARQL